MTRVTSTIATVTEQPTPALDTASIRYGRARARIRAANLEVEAAQRELDEARRELRRALGDDVPHEV